MILLDANVISEPLRAAPDGHVMSWLDRQAVDTFYLSVITVAELRLGVATLPAGKRRDKLNDRVEGAILPVFAGRVLPFDLEASETFAKIVSQASSQGKAIGKADGYIAATCALRGFSIATRDVFPFVAAGLTVINPWNA
jgi:predicted nucleic acid-binding protein